MFTLMGFHREKGLALPEYRDGFLRWPRAFGAPRWTTSVRIAFMISRVFASCRRWRPILGTLAAVAAGISSARGATMAEDLFPELGGLLRDAVTQSPRVLDQNLQRLQAEQQILSSSSRLYPQATLGVNYNLQYEDRSTVTSDWEFNNRYNLAFTVAYPLLHWGALRAEADIGRLLAASAANNVVQVFRQLALDIRRTYLQAAIDRVALRNSRFADEIVRRRLDLLQVEVDSGRAPSGALGEARIAVEEAALGLERTSRTLEITLRALRRLTGRAGLTVESIPTAIPAVTVVTPEDATAQGNTYVTQRRYLDDARRANLGNELHNEKHRLHIYAVNQRPKIDLITGASLDQLTYVSDVGQRTGVTAGFVGVRVNWNVFDGYNTRGRLLMARTRVRQLETQLSVLEEELQYAASQSGSELALAARALLIAEGRFGGALGSFNLVSEDFGRQRASQDQVDNTRLTLNEWELRMFMARVGYLNAVAAWLFSVNADPAVPASIAPPSS